MILGKGKLNEAKEIKRILHSYGLASEEKVNGEKSEIFIFNMIAQEESRIASFLGYIIGQLPFTYLGMPLDKGIETNKLYDPLNEKVRKRLSSWKGLWLTGAERLTLIKTVLAAMPIYLLSCIPLSKGAHKKLTQAIRIFYWQGTEDRNKLKLIAWDKICRERCDGGTGIRKNLWKNKALRAKLVWRLYTSSKAEWARILKNKYLTSNHREAVFRDMKPPKGSRIWNFIKECRTLISNFLSRNICDGKSALFWEVSWGDILR
ncbi:uncharacterized mitochondrial protein AtMg00310-like [Cryptomeria japonica]|uniref:uncharacterized mitochondrial protein AtMg00310-like n=1 Tax=Cryptomeria japonica TaxID=3369 RepID=UPI0027DA7478|nr:uncharacterized mitochondrial protein AtMg00310-like [Cryptomeria japonica]